MILVDMNQVTISNLMIQMKNEPLSVDLVRHLVLNSIRSYRTKFFNEFGELILCYDDKHYWRRDLFPYYKSNRKKDRTESNLNWNELFETLNLIRDELKETIPYKVLQVDGAEADDIIATIVNLVSKTPNLFEKILIMSGDKDFIQLQTHENVQQYSPTLKKFINGVDPNTYKIEHIFKGNESIKKSSAASGTDPVNFLDRIIPNLRKRRGGPSGGAYYQLPSKSGLVQSMEDEANCCRTWQWIPD